MFVSVGSVNCNIFNCDDGDCGKKCRIVKGRDQVEITVNSGVVYGHIKDSAGEVFETDLKKGVTYYLFTEQYLSTSPTRIAIRPSTFLQLNLNLIQQTFVV